MKALKSFNEMKKALKLKQIDEKSFPPQIGKHFTVMVQQHPSTH